MLLSFFCLTALTLFLVLQTIMAHGCYLSDEELKIFHQTGSSLAHCPNSNLS
jgi:guanine deaminase